MQELIPLFKTFHIVGFVAWFAGMFYLVRIFVYHTEAKDRSEPDQSILIKEFNAMEWRVYNIICNPGMMITWTFGLLLIFAYGFEWLGTQPWMHIKLTLIILLTGYHLYNKSIIRKLEKGQDMMSSYKFRLYNEVPSVFLLLIVLLAVYKNGLNYTYTTIGVLGFVLLLFISTKFYKTYRDRKSS